MDKKIYDELCRQNDLLRKQNKILEDQLSDQTALLRSIQASLRDLPELLITLANQQKN